MGTRYLRSLLGIDGGDTDADDLDLLAAADAEGGELRAGVSVTEDGWTAVACRGLDLAATQAAEGTDGNTSVTPTCGGRRVRVTLAPWHQLALSSTHPVTWGAAG